MELNWIADIFKVQGPAIGGFVAVLVILSLLIKRVLGNYQKREENLTKLLTNHLEENTKMLLLISENLKKSSQEHSRMLEFLIKINERVKV